MLRFRGARPASARPGTAALALVAFLGVLLVPAVASAHSVLIETDPTTGSVAATPDAVRLTFNERPQARFSVVQVVGPDGARRDAGNLSVLNDVVSEPLQGTRPAGVYTVNWRVVSADGHPVSGQWRFTAASAAPALAAVSGPSQAPESGGSGGHGAHVVLIVGIVVLMLALLAVERLRNRRRVRPGDGTHPDLDDDEEDLHAHRGR